LRSRAVDKNYYLTMGDTRETLGQGKRDIGGHWGTLGDKGKIGRHKGDYGRQWETEGRHTGDNGRQWETFGGIKGDIRD
jgi:hypothetical protein